MAEKTTISLSAELLTAVLGGNRELFLELHIGKVLARCREEFPVLQAMRIGEDLTIDVGAVPDTEEAVRAIGSVIQTIREFLELFVGPEDAWSNIVKEVGRFKGENRSLIDGLQTVIPEILSMDADRKLLELDKASAHQQARHIFLEIFKVALREPDEEKKLQLSQLLKSCSALASVSEDAGSFDVIEATDIEIIIDQLSDVVDRIGLVPADVSPILNRFGVIPESLGLNDRLFNGALSSVTSFGLRSVDARFREGISRDSILLLKGPASVAKLMLSNIFVKEGLERGGCVIMISSLRSPEEQKECIGATGVDIESAEAEGRYIVVDWFTRHVRRITGIEEEGNVIRVSDDLTNLAVGMGMALKRALGFASCRLVLDMVSPAIVVEGFERVQEFLEAARAKLKGANCTSLVLVNDGVHNPEQMKIIEDIFDGTLSLTRSVDNGMIKHEVNISAYAEGAFDRSPIQIDFGDRGLSFRNMENGEEDLVKFERGMSKSSLGLPGIESVTSGGLPVGQTYLLWMSTKIMPGDFIKPLFLEGLKENNAIILATSSISIKGLQDWAISTGQNLHNLINTGRLGVIDWSTRKESLMQGVEEKEGVIRPSKDTTHLGVGIDMALRKLGSVSQTIAVLEVLSSALRRFDLRTVYPFAMSTMMRLKYRGITSFVIMERGTHDPKVNSAMEEMFDGVIDIQDAGDHLEIAVLSLRNSHFQPEYRILNHVRDRFTVDVARARPDMETVTIVEDMETMARINRLNLELKEAQEENKELERRMEEFAKKEEEMERKHGELRTHLFELERVMSEQESGAEGLIAQKKDLEHKKEVAQLLDVMDDLLEDLPGDIVERFATSEEFKLYEKIITLYREEIK